MAYTGALIYWYLAAYSFLQWDFFRQTLHFDVQWKNVKLYIAEVCHIDMSSCTWILKYIKYKYIHVRAACKRCHSTFLCFLCLSVLSWRRLTTSSSPSSVHNQCCFSRICNSWTDRALSVSEAKRCLGPGNRAFFLKRLSRYSTLSVANLWIMVIVRILKTGLSLLQPSL